MKSFGWFLLGSLFAVVVVVLGQNYRPAKCEPAKTLTNWLREVGK